MPDQSNPTGAVFLSYGSEDADAAARICETLRKAGVEVWLDKSELRGGDAWDAQIKKQIHDCKLFVPLISARTNARTEGYFRREWKLATRRLLDMSDDAAFLVPVVIDATREADARVPEEFLGVQWTRLPNGETSPAFAHRVSQLLGGAGATVRNSQTAVAGDTEPSTRKGLSVRPWFWFAGGHGKHRMGSVGIALIVLLLALGAGTLWYYEGAGKVPAEPSPATASPIAAVAPHEKSIAVLPFVNMSSDTEQEYFSDGISEELLNLLAKIPELRVISRSSAFSFKGKDIEVPEIAKRLNVAHVLEGSVRKSGNQVRIAVQLIEARSDTHLWSEIYDRELTDIFAVQDEIALAVVQQLKLALLGDDLPARSKTTNLEAYNLYLQGQHLIDQNTEEGFVQAVEFFGKALESDPHYGDAWAALANAQAMMATQGFKDVSVGFAEARVSAQKALDLDPNLARAHFALGAVQYFHDWDWLAANESLKKAIALDPSDSWALSNAGAVAQMLGTQDAGISLFKQAVAHDPIAVLPRAGLAQGYFYAGHLDDAENETRTVLERSPEFAAGWNMLSTILLLKGQTASALVAIQKEPVEFWRLAGLSLAYFAMGKKELSDAVLKEFIEKQGDAWAYQIAEIYAYRGQKEEAFAWLDRAYRQRDTGLTSIRRDPLLEKIKSDSRYAAMLRKLNLPEP